jgi:predicted RNA binding protein YcfA (HicA-like mRNA interferase family)
LPRLISTAGEFIAIIEQHEFVLHRQGATSHRRYRGIVNGEVRYVDVAVHGLNASIKPSTMQSMIRQSGLPKILFRK